MWLHCVLSIPGMNPIGLSRAGTPGNLSWSFPGWKRTVIQWLERYSQPWDNLRVISSQYFSIFFYKSSHIVFQVPMYKTKITALQTTLWRLGHDIPSAKGKTANENKKPLLVSPSNNLQQFLRLQLSYMDAKQNYRSEEKSWRYREVFIEETL